MLGMFYQTSFNQPIGTKVVTVITYTAWDTLNVTNMRVMFFKTISNNLSINN
jgi:hypothetical protein